MEHRFFPFSLFFLFVCSFFDLRRLIIMYDIPEYIPVWCGEIDSTGRKKLFFPFSGCSTRTTFRVHIISERLSFSLFYSRWEVALFGINSKRLSFRVKREKTIFSLIREYYHFGIKNSKRLVSSSCLRKKNSFRHKMKPYVNDF